MAYYKTKFEKRTRRHNRIRQKISGTSEIPRLYVRFSNKNIYAALIDDENSKTILAFSTLSRNLREQKIEDNLKGAEILGKLLGEKVVDAGIKKIVFDRGGFKYHGRVKMIADMVRKAGVQF